MAAHKRETKGTQARGSATPREPGTAAGRGAGSYILEWANCGSPYCRTCAPGGQGSHGPYWYRYFWQAGRHRKQYVGKTLPQAAGSEAAGQGIAQPGGQASA